MKNWHGLRDFLIIILGQTFATIGTRMSSFALGIWILQTRGSVSEFAMTFLAVEVPTLIISPVAGPLVDRWNRRGVMLCCDAICSLTMLTLALLLASHHLALWEVYAGIVLMAVCSTFHQPAFRSSIPHLAMGDMLPRVNALIESVGAGSSIIAPLLAGVLVTKISLYGVLGLDALGYAIAVVTLLCARIPQPSAPEHDAGKGVWHEAVTGWRFVYAHKALLGLLCIDGFRRFIFSIACVLITPLLLTMTTPAMVGVQWATSSAGMLVGGLLVTVLGAPKRIAMSILLMMLYCGFFLALHGVAPSYLLVVVSGAVMFVSMPVMATLNVTIWQSKVPASLQGRCFAIRQVMTSAATPLGYLIAGPLAERVFEPMLAKGGVLAGTVGALIGTGPGRGIGLIFIILGGLMMLMAIGASRVAAIRQADDLPNEFSPQAEGPHETQPATA